MSETKDQDKQRPDIEPPETGQGAPISEEQGELFSSKAHFLKGFHPVLFPAREYFMEAVLAELAPEAIRSAGGVFLEDKTEFMAWAREHLIPDQIRLLESTDKWIAEWKGVDKEKGAEVLRRWKDEGKQDALATSTKEILAILAKEKEILAKAKEYPHGSRNIEDVHKAIMGIDAEIEQLRSREAEAASALFRLAELFENERAREIKEAEQRGIEKGREIERKEQSEQEKKEGALPLPSMQSIPPEKAVMANSKVANNLSRLHEKAGEPHNVIVSTTKKGGNVLVAVTLDYDAENLHTSKKISAYDREVHNAICTLYEAGNKEFTPTMVYRAMNGLQEGEWVTQESIERVSESINKLRHTHMTIDCTDQVEGWRLPKQKEGKPSLILDDSMLSVMGVRMRNHNGEEIEAYRFNTLPILYRYSKQIGHVLTVPMRVLNTKKRLRTTEEVTTIRAYLIRRIQAMRGSNVIKARQIRYEAIMDEAGINLDGFSNQRKKKKAVMDQVDAILQHFKEEGEIGSARRYKEGRADAGVEIELPDK